MNENIKVTEILKDCPKGFEFWSKAHGVVTFQKIDLSKDYPICVKGRNGINYFSSTGQYYVEGECILIPSKDQRDWSKFSAPWLKRERFDPKTLNPFDKVLARDSLDEKWHCDFFSHISDSLDYPYETVNTGCAFCIPYNDDTKHLAGTRDEAPEFYRYWED